jgi:asparagine N-glycosylation enzyme membrane subunit Stt3
MIEKFLDDNGYLIYTKDKQIGLWIDEDNQPIYDKVDYIEAILIKNNKITQKKNNWRLNYYGKKHSYIKLIVNNGEIIDIVFNTDGFYYYNTPEMINLFIDDYKSSCRDIILESILKK